MNKEFELYCKLEINVSGSDKFVLKQLEQSILDSFSSVKIDKLVLKRIDDKKHSESKFDFHNRRDTL